MNIFVAGASGAIGRPLINELIRRGHTVIGMTRTEKGARYLTDLGAKVAQIDVFDLAAVTKTFQDHKIEVVIDELTSLPAHQKDMPSYAAGDRKVRLEGGAVLYRAAQATGVKRYIQQLSGFFVEPGHGLADETAGMAIHATPGVAAGAQTYADLETRMTQPGKLEGVGLRYGFFYGPGTWYNPDGTAADMVRQQQVPIIGDGEGVWSWIHIDDAAIATADALTIPPGVYHIVDDEPLPVSRWLPAFAKYIGAPVPMHVTVEQALATAGEDAVYYGTKLRGTSNTKAKQTFGFKPRPHEWLTQ
jgi:nucleoside-diphosphate-sugar epimerase